MKRELVLTYKEYSSRNELPLVQRELIERAEKVAKDAYAPYSNFCVGSCVLLENGEFFMGNNQENAAYPSGICAERVALFYASAQYPLVPVRAVAIIATADFFDNLKPVTPCGACRQVLIEYEQKFNKPIEIILASKQGRVLIFENAATLLPFVFEAKLKK